MNLIELHIIQSFPVSCLNRDDLGSPKSAVFGGVKRARISSQCLKRAQRMAFREYAPEYAKGERTKLIASLFLQLLHKKSEMPDDKAREIAEKLAKEWGKIDDARKDSNDLPKATTLTYISPEEAEAMVSAALSLLREKEASKLVENNQQIAELANTSNDAKLASNDTGKKKTKQKKEKSPEEKFKEEVKAAMKKAVRKSAADIALFGRMVANDPSLNVEGAAHFSHAISCHKAVAEMDFYTAVDDLQPEDESGAGMTGVLEFNSACYYRYIGVNVDLLKRNLPVCSDEELRVILDAFIRSALVSVPSARKNSMNAATLPSYVLGVRRSGHPLQLVNAFEAPVRPKKGEGGYVEDAVGKLKEELKRMETTWGYKTDEKVVLPDVGIEDFITRLIGTLE